MKASLNKLASVRLVSNGCRYTRSFLVVLTLAVCKPDGESRRFWLALADIGRGVPHPAAVATNIRRELHVRHHCTRCQCTYYSPSTVKAQHTVVVGADLERLVSAHHQPGLAVLTMLEQPDIARTALLPLPRVLVEFEQLGSHLECLLLQLLVRLGIHLFRQAYDWLEVGIRLFFVCLVVL